MTEKQNSTAEVRAKRWNGWGTAMVVSALIAVIAPVFGLLGTVFGMVGAFDELGKEGGADPEELSGDISTSLITTAGGLIAAVVFGILALVFLVLFLVKLDRDNKAAFSENS